MTKNPNQPSRDDRIRDAVIEFRQLLAQGRYCDHVEFSSRFGDLADELSPILRAIAATEPVVASAADIVIDEDSQKSDPANATINWSSHDDAGSSEADLTFTHVPGTGSTSRSEPAGISSRMKLGTTVADYRILRLLGRGGMGEVFEAEEIGTNRRFAVKMLSSTLPRTKETVERFLNEASLAASLSHPNTTFVFGAGQDGDQFFIVMELMPGHTLKDLVESEGPRAVGEAVDFVLDILAGLEAAHTFGVIHRDLKPSNCFVDGNGSIKVGDFGLAKSLVASADITQTGTFLGTPQFAAPEQIRHEDVDQRTDIFAVGATLFYMLTGEPPFTGDPAAVIAKIVADKPPDIRSGNAEVPRSLARIVNRCMHKSPSKRFSSAAQLRRLLLPFSSQGTSMSDIGRRMAAFMLDLVFVAAITTMLAVVYFIVREALENSGASRIPRALFDFSAYVSIFSVLYFAFLEGVTGKSIGKRILGIRVVDAFGESPGLMRGLVRALAFPGAFLTSVDILHSVVSRWESYQEFLTFILPQELMRNFVDFEGFLIFKSMMALLCFSTMRRISGFRGIHELVSGTRVVRTRTESRKSIFRRLARYWGKSRQREGLPAALGPYKVIGEIGGSAHVNVLEGRDESLSRNIWLYCASTPFDGESAIRAAVNRPTRQRWLQTGEQEGVYWQAVEAIDGGPVLALLDSAGSIPWEAGRELLPALAEELVAAVEDGTLPEYLTLDQIWLDRDGGLRLLDFPLWRQESLDQIPEVDLAGTNAGEGPWGRAWFLFREVAARCRLDMETPGRAVDELDACFAAPPNRGSLIATGERLRRLTDMPYTLNWDSRLGLTAVSLGVEFSLIMAWCFVVAMWVTSLARYDFVSSLAAGIPLAAALPAVIGYVFHGGIAFSLSEFQVRTVRTRSASRVRAAVRNLIAWLPLVIPVMVIRVWIFMYSEQGRQFLDKSNDSTFFTFFGGGMLITASLIVAGVGFLFAIISEPRRGLPDLIARTYLVKS